MNLVFVSYSHKDKRWLQRLQTHLKPLQDQGLIDLWDATRIAPGAQWKNEIEQALAEARVAVLLVSADFLASDFITKNELPPVLTKAGSDGTAILAVIVSPCRFLETSSLSRFQAVNSPSRPLVAISRAKQEQVFVALSHRIEEVLGISSLPPEDGLPKYDPSTCDSTNASREQSSEEGKNKPIYTKRLMAHDSHSVTTNYSHSTWTTLHTKYLRIIMLILFVAVTQQPAPPSIMLEPPGPTIEIQQGEQIDITAQVRSSFPNPRVHWIARCSGGEECQVLNTDHGLSNTLRAPTTPGEEITLEVTVTDRSGQSRNSLLVVKTRAPATQTVATIPAEPVAGSTALPNESQTVIPTSTPIPVAVPNALTDTPVPARPAEGQPVSPTLSPSNWDRTRDELDKTWEKDWPQTVRLLESFIQENPSHTEAREKYYSALISYGDLLLQTSDKDSAIEQYVRAAELGTRDGTARARLNALTPTPTPVPAPTRTPIPIPPPIVAPRPPTVTPTATKPLPPLP